MRRARTVLTSGFFAIVLVVDTCAQSGADECLTQPTGPTPQGQHWYYRLDHANDGRQCWYLRAENGRAQKASTKVETSPADAMAQTIEAPRGAAAARAEPSPEKNASVAVAPIPWLNIFIPAVAPAKPDSAPRNADAIAGGSSEATTIEKSSDPVPVTAPRPAASADGDSAPTYRVRELQRRQQIQARPEPSRLAPAFADVDHTFGLLMIVLVALAIAGPALHLVERRRRRKANSFCPPSWARVVALNASVARVRQPMLPRPETMNRPAPAPIEPAEQTERLAYALQQLVDRMQTVNRPEPKSARMRTSPRVARRASM
jgi:hypothetical protein